MDAIALRPSEAARLAGVSRSVLYSAITSGDLKSFRLHSMRLIFADELRAWLDRHAAGEQEGRR
jgi:excisionase family DNA binding protein